MSTISNVSSSSSYGYSLPASNTAANPVAQTSNSGLVQEAASLSAIGNIVTTLGGGSTSSLTYDAAGLLNTLVQAGTASSSSQTTANSANPASAQNSTDQGIVNTLATSSTASGVYTSSGSLQGLPSNTSATWASALKNNPGLASTVISDSFNQGIVGTLSTTA